MCNEMFARVECDDTRLNDNKSNARYRLKFKFVNCKCSSLTASCALCWYPSTINQVVIKSFIQRVTFATRHLSSCAPVSPPPTTHMCPTCILHSLLSEAFRADLHNVAICKPCATPLSRCTHITLSKVTLNKYLLNSMSLRMRRKQQLPNLFVHSIEHNLTLMLSPTTCM